MQCRLGCYAVVIEVEAVYSLQLRRCAEQLSQRFNLRRLQSRQRTQHTPGISQHMRCGDQADAASMLLNINQLLVAEDATQQCLKRLKGCVVGIVFALKSFGTHGPRTDGPSF